MTTTTCGLTPARGCGSCDSCLGKGPGPMRNKHPNLGYTLPDGILETLWGYPVAVSIEVEPGIMIAISGAIKLNTRTLESKLDHDAVLNAIDHYQKSLPRVGLPLEMRRT